MESKPNKTFSVVLPLTYQIKQIRKQLPFFKYLVFAVEVLFFLSFPLNFSKPNSDHTMKGIIDVDYFLT